MLHQVGVFIYWYMMHGTMKLKKTTTPVQSSVAPLRISALNYWKRRRILVNRAAVLYIQSNEGRQTGLVTSVVRTAFWDTLLTEIWREGYKWRDNEEEGVSSYWNTARKGEDTINWKKGSTRSRCEENLLLGGALDFSCTAHQILCLWFRAS